MIQRRKTKEVKIGSLIVGGEHAITVQSMTTAKTYDVKATLKEVERLEEAGCQIIRITVPDQPSADALYEIKKQMNVPLVADIHFNYRMALEAVDAGADKIRINPGNIGGKKRVKEVLEKVKGANLPIRIGVNAGSLEKDLIEKYGYGAFHDTDLNDDLGRMGVGSLVITGTVTQICVEETGREAFHRGYPTTMVSDAVSSFDAELHRATLRNFAMKFGWVQTAVEVKAAIQNL